MTKNRGTLKVRTLVQAALFEQEIRGQLSDGAWENTRPDNHWQNWSEARVKVDPNDIGRNFWVVKDNYSLTTLIEYVGDRMIAYAKAAIAFPELVKELMEADLRIPDSEWAWNYYVALTESTGEIAPHRQETSDIFAKHGVTKVAWNLGLLQVPYTEKNLRKDLGEIKMAMKTERRGKSGGWAIDEVTPDEELKEKMEAERIAKLTAQSKIRSAVQNLATIAGVSSDMAGVSKENFRALIEALSDFSAGIPKAD